MRKNRSFPAALASLALLAAIAGPAARARAEQVPGALAAAQGVELWGGPGARGAGAGGARFDTKVTVSAVSPATGSVEFYVQGTAAAKVPFTLPARGVVSIQAPAEADGKGAFLYKVTADSPVSAWSETYNETSAGRYGVSVAAAGPTELLSPGDEASAGGADASSSTAAGRARTNVGVVCSPGSKDPCQLEVAVYDGGAFLGTGLVNAQPGWVSQSPLATLVPAAAEKANLALRLRLLLGAGLPYAVRNDNQTSDGTLMPLAVTRSAFSTAPSIDSFTASPATGCAPVTSTLTWSTRGAVRVSIPTIGESLPPNGSATLTTERTLELVLTAYAPTGETASKPVKITTVQSTPPPTPTPQVANVLPSGRVSGTLPAGLTGPVTIEFTQQQSGDSSFVLSGTSFLYTAGKKNGVDVVKLSVTGDCGTATATFTANVSGTATGPEILVFEAVMPENVTPPRGCYPKSVATLRWLTRGTESVTITGIEFPVPSGNEQMASTAIEITSPTTFTLTATAPDNRKVSQSLSIGMDSMLYFPTVDSPLGKGSNPNEAIQLQSDQPLVLTISTVPTPVDLTQVGWYIIQFQSYGRFERISPSQFYYTAGPAGGLDGFRFGYHNGCGVGNAEFWVKVTPLQ